MHQLSGIGHRIVQDLAKQNGFSEAAVEALLRALAKTGGRSAQFDHPELGGMGQWQGGGMLMIGDMFNDRLRNRVARLCTELTERLSEDILIEESGPPGERALSQTQTQRQGAFRRDQGRTDEATGAWWPSELGTPSATGAQNAMRYACFPESRRLVIVDHGGVSVYDTGEHRISGVSQQQSTAQSLTFTSQLGSVRLDQLRVVGRN